mgnify:CR=1 FL=1
MRWKFQENSNVESSAYHAAAKTHPAAVTDCVLPGRYGALLLLEFQAHSVLRYIRVRALQGLAVAYAHLAFELLSLGTRDEVEPFRHERVFEKSAVLTLRHDKAI